MAAAQPGEGFPTWKMGSQLMYISGDRITPIYKPWSSAISKGSRGLTITMVMNHLQVLG